MNTTELEINGAKWTKSSQDGLWYIAIPSTDKAFGDVYVSRKDGVITRETLNGYINETYVSEYGRKYYLYKAQPKEFVKSVDLEDFLYEESDEEECIFLY